MEQFLKPRPRVLGCRSGFTLIELTIVVAIISILASIAIPRFSDMLTYSNEASTKGNLATLRSALSMYYADTEGTSPSDDLQCLATDRRYINAIPNAVFPAHS